MSTTENNYQETDLGNVSLNPRGEYDPGASYEYLDTVSYQGGSYTCLAELGTTITGIAPDPGRNTDAWQMLTLPGDLKPEYIAMHDDTVNHARQAESSRLVAELAQQAAEDAQADIQQLHTDTRQAATEAGQSRDSAAGYAQPADASRKAAAESEQNINAQVTGFDTKVSESVTQAQEEIATTRQQAIRAVASQQVTSTQAVKDQTASYITEKETSAKTEIGNYTLEKIAEINKKASEANTTLANTIADGTSLKTQLETTISTADTSKKNLDASNTVAGKTKTALDVSNTTATKTKADLDASNTTASEAKTGLDATNKTAADLVASLGDEITEGTQVKTDIQTTGETAMSNLQAEAKKQQEYIKTSIDDTLSISGKAADAAVTGKKIDSLKEDLDNKITKFYASNQGETHITDSDNGKIQDMMIYGKSSQDGTPTPENPVEIKSVVNPTVKVTNEDGLKVQSVTLNNITLNAIPVSSGGNVTIGGQQYISDYVDIEKGKLYRKVKRLNLKDVDDIGITHGFHSNGNGYLSFSIGSANKEQRHISNRYKSSEWTQESGYSYIPNNDSIVFVDDRFTDRQTAIKLVQDTYVIYALSLQTEEDLSSEQIKSLKSLSTYYPTTNISVNSEQLDGYTVFNYPTPFEDEWNKTQKEIGSLKEDLDNLREIEFYPNLLNKAEFLAGKQMVTSAGSTPDDLVDNENTVTTNIINCDGDEYFETNLPNGHTVILAYFWYQEKWYRSQFISSLEVEGDHFKFKINAQMKKIRIYCTSNMMPANPILTKQGEYDESKPEFFPKGKIKLTPSGCVGYDNLDEDTKQRINNKTSDYSEYIPFYGKKIVGIGDSIMVGIKSDGSAIIDGIGKNGLPCTDQGYQINSTGGFLGELRKKYPSINVVNMGVGSTTMQRNDNVNVNKVYKCIMDRIDSIPDDADIIILEGGINDFFHASKGCVLGTYKDNLYKYPTSAKYENEAYSYVEFAVDTTLDASTFCGALEIALTKILVRFVGKPFIYVIPHNPSASADIDTFFNSAKEICEKYGVPVVDIRKTGCMPRIYTLSGKTDGTSAFTQDGVHPNPLGYQLHYVPAIASTLKSIM